MCQVNYFRWIKWIHLILISDFNSKQFLKEPKKICKYEPALELKICSVRSENIDMKLLMLSKDLFASKYLNGTRLLLTSSWRNF